MNFQFFTLFKAKLWGGGVGDSVDTGIGALVRELPVEMLSQQGVGGGANHFHRAALVGLGLPHGVGEDEEGRDQPVDEVHPQDYTAG